MPSPIHRLVTGLLPLALAAPAAAQICVDTCPTPPTIVDDRSIVVHDAATLDAADFTFARTVGAIVRSGGQSNTAAHRADFVQSLIDTFESAPPGMINGGVMMPIDFRPGEASLDPADLLDPDGGGGMIPVGLFNRTHSP